MEATLPFAAKLNPNLKDLISNLLIREKEKRPSLDYIFNHAWMNSFGEFSTKIQTQRKYSRRDRNTKAHSDVKISYLGIGQKNGLNDSSMRESGASMNQMDQNLKQSMTNGRQSLQRGNRDSIIMEEKRQPNLNNSMNYNNNPEQNFS